MTLRIWIALIYWCFTTTLVKTDMKGSVLKQVPVDDHHTPSELMVSLLALLMHWFSDRKFVFAEDNVYGSLCLPPSSAHHMGEQNRAGCEIVSSATTPQWQEESSEDDSDSNLTSTFFDFMGIDRRIPVRQDFDQGVAIALLDGASELVECEFIHTH